MDNNLSKSHLKIKEGEGQINDKFFVGIFFQKETTAPFLFYLPIIFQIPSSQNSRKIERPANTNPKIYAIAILRKLKLK